MCRLQVAWALHNWTVEDWENIGWSDESLQQHKRTNSTIYQPFRLLLLLLVSVSVRYFSLAPSRLLTTNWADATAYTSIVADNVHPLIDTWTHLLMAWNRPGTIKNPQSSQTCFWNLTILCYAVHKRLPRLENFNPTRHYWKLNYWKWKMRILQPTKYVATVCTNSIFQSIAVSSCFKGRKEVQSSTCNVYQMVELLSGIMKLLKQNAGN